VIFKWEVTNLLLLMKYKYVIVEPGDKLQRGDEYYVNGGWFGMPNDHIGKAPTMMARRKLVNTDIYDTGFHDGAQAQQYRINHFLDEFNSDSPSAEYTKLERFKNI